MVLGWLVRLGSLFVGLRGVGVSLVSGASLRGGWEWAGMAAHRGTLFIEPGCLVSSLVIRVKPARYLMSSLRVSGIVFDFGFVHGYVESA
jgi:hypothetical protein